MPIDITKNNLLFDDDFNLMLKDEILLNSLKMIIFSEKNLELLLRKARKDILNILSRKDYTLNYYQKEFIISLAFQCYLNEYVYFITKEELDNLEKIISDFPKNKDNKSIITIIC